MPGRSSTAAEDTPRWPRPALPDLPGQGSRQSVLLLYPRPRLGLTFIKFSSYAPFPVRVWLNGHEWAKRQLDRKRIRYQSLDNGFLTCEEPKALQDICHSLGTDDVESFFRRWLKRLPHPFTPKDRAAGYTYQLSILQMEVSLTQVFDRPVHGREFFEEVIRDNLDIGRPDQVQLLFERKITPSAPLDAFLTPLGRRVALFMTKSFSRVVRPVLHRVDPELPANPDDPLRRAWLACDREIDRALAQARIAA